MSEESQPEVKFTGNIRRLRLRPGDKVVFEVPEDTPVERVQELAGAMTQHFPDNEVLILGGGFRVAAVISAPKVALPTLGANGFAHR